MWRHSFIVGSLGPNSQSRATGTTLPSGTPSSAACPFAPSRTAISSTSERGNVPTAAFQQDNILGATGAAAVSH